MGVGEELRRLLESAGITSLAGCQCSVREAEMSIRGTDWCRENIDTIVGWMRDEAKRRNWPLFSDRIATYAVKIAIRRAERSPE